MRQAAARLGLLLGMFALMMTSAWALVPEMVTDLNYTPAAGLLAGERVALGGVYYYGAYNPTAGKTELWRSDGTPLGTGVVRAISAGGPANPQQMAVMNGQLYFNGADPVSGALELWESDGTAAGTVKVRAASAGGPVDPQSLTAIGATIYFSAYDAGPDAYELWKSDGTAGGTVKVRAASAGGPTNPQFLTAVDSTLYFNGFIIDPSHGGENELWKSDGTAGGTVMVRATHDGGPANPIFLTAVGGSLYFNGFSALTGQDELWKSDGTLAGTAVVKFSAIGGPISPTFLTNVGGTLYFNAATDAASTQFELWKSNGTGAGTVVVSPIIAGGPTDPQFLTSMGGSLYFCDTDSFGDTVELWKSDGTTSGTGLVMSPDGPASPENLVAVGNTLYFTAREPGTQEPKLWRSDGTAPGTAVLQPSGTLGAYNLVGVANSLYFDAYDPAGGDFTMWKSDGAPENTELITNLTVQTADLTIADQEAAERTLFFSATGPNATTNELWKSDGSAFGTELVKPISDNGPFDPRELTALGKDVYFNAGDLASGEFELWKSDGSPSGTFVVKPVSAGGPADPQLLTAMGDDVFFFSAFDFTSGEYELWSSDGTDAGTSVVIPSSSGGPLFPQFMVAVNNTLYMNAFDQSEGTYTLWRSNGTPSGTAVVKPVSAGGPENPSFLTALGSTLYFIAYNTAGGYYELWRSDGTDSGTAIVSSAGSGGPANPGFLTALGGTLFFGASTLSAINTYELWKSDGTPGGTSVVKPISAGGPNDPQYLAAMGGALYFTDSDSGGNSVALWHSDGTAAGTLPFSLNSLGGPAAPEGLVAATNTLYFNAMDRVHGRELWKIDLVANNPPAADAGGPYQAEKIGSTASVALSTASASDPDASDTLVYQWSTNAPGASFSDPTALNPTLTFDASAGVDTTYNVTLVVSDGAAFANDTASVRIVDTQPPVITLNGPASLTLNAGDPYVEQGATATDAADGTVPVTIGGDTVNTAVAGTYIVTYNARDGAGNDAVQVTRTVTVVPATTPTITVTSPATGATWQRGTPQTITWNSSGLTGNVKVFVSLNGGPWINIAFDIANTGSLPWTVNQGPSANCKIRVTSMASNALFGESGVFTITPAANPPTITVTNPAGGETWGKGVSNTIQWNSANLTGNVKLFVSLDGGPWLSIANNVPNTGSYAWTVNQGPSANCRIRVTSMASNAVFGESGLFTITSPFIVTSPAGGAALQKGTVQPVTWSTVGVTGNVKIFVSVDNGPWTNIAWDIPNTGAFNWTINQGPSTNCKIRVTSMANNSVFGESGVFTISSTTPPPSITVTNPAGGESWAKGSTHAIQWTSANLTGNVKAFVSVDNGPWTNIAWDIPNTGSFNWTVNQGPSANCKVRVTSMANNAIFGESGAFTITP